MLRRYLPIMLTVGLVQCSPAGMVSSVPQEPKARIQKTAEPVVYTQAQLDSSFAEWTSTVQNPINFRLDGELKKRWSQLISESTWGEVARRCTTAFLETGQVSLTMEYRDYVRLRAARHHASVRALLSEEEHAVLMQAEQCAQQVLRPGMSDMQKLLALHDFLVSHARYDENGGCNVADILCNGAGCCEAYSATLCLLLDIAGIPARFVTGRAREPHAWNLVQLDGAWYHVDATWDDPVVGDASRQTLSHAYFCLSDAEISHTHEWNRASYPVSGAGDAFYYRVTRTYFTSFAAYWQAAMAAYRRGDPRFEGYLTTYGSHTQFQSNLKRVASGSTPAQVRWTGPETSAGAVVLTFGE